MNVVDLLNNTPHHLHPDFTGTTGGLYQGDDNYPFFERLAAELNPKSILEVGVRMGWSAISFLSGAKEADYYVGLDHQEIPGSNQLAGENIEYFAKETGRNMVVHMFNVDSQTITNLDFLEGKTFDMIFIDACHTYEGCYRDLQTFWPILNNGGAIVVDDTCMEDIKRAAVTFAQEVKAVNYDAGKSLRGDWVIKKPNLKAIPPRQIIIQERPEFKPFADDFHGDEITLTVATGLGDIFWVYQKFAPYFDKINFDIACVGNFATKEESRAERWMKCLPKVNNIKKIECPEAIQLGYQYPQMADSIEAWKSGQKPIFYCCNHWLEDGIRLEDIDPGAKVEFGIPMTTEACELPFDEYVLFYIAGVGYPALTSQPFPHLQADPFNLWDVNTYLRMIDVIYEKYNLSLPVVMIGAKWDSHLYPLVEKHLAAKGIRSHGMFDDSPERVIHIIKNAKLFLAYQCGLSVVADNFNIPQIVVYFPKYDKARYAWGKKENARRICHETTYASKPEDIVEELQLEVLKAK